MIKAMALGDVGLSEHLCWWGDKHMVSPNHSYTRDPSHGPHHSPALCLLLGYPSMDQRHLHHCQSHLSSSLSPRASRC